CTSQQKDGLRSMITSAKLRDSIRAKKMRRQEMVEFVLTIQFWKNVVNVIRITKPLVKVLTNADSDSRPILGYIYETMDNGNCKCFKHKTGLSEKYWKSIDHSWDKEQHHIINASAYYLNPQCFHNKATFSTHLEVTMA
ncbi:hypothetical protein AMTR_s00140p00066330, partial [Amborella trichopoda]